MESVLVESNFSNEPEQLRGPVGERLLGVVRGSVANILILPNFLPRFSEDFSSSACSSTRLYEKICIEHPTVFFWRAQARYRYGGRSEENVAWWEEEEEDSRGDNNSSWFSGWASA